MLAADGRLLISVPCGEPGDYAGSPGRRRWLDMRLFTGAGFFVEEQEVYELTEEGWRTAPELDPTGLRYGDRGPAASAVLCAELSPRRLRRLLSPDGIERGRRRPDRCGGSANSPFELIRARGSGPSCRYSFRRAFDPGGNECACCWSTTMPGSASSCGLTFEDVQVEVDEARLARPRPRSAFPRRVRT